MRAGSSGRHTASPRVRQRIARADRRESRPARGEGRSEQAGRSKQGAAGGAPRRRISCAEPNSMRKLIHAEILEQRLTPEQAHAIERHPIVAILENIRSLYNVGSCFRTADAML